MAPSPNFQMRRVRLRKSRSLSEVTGWHFWSWDKPWVCRDGFMLCLSLPWASQSQVLTHPTSWIQQATSIPQPPLLPHSHQVVLGKVHLSRPAALRHPQDGLAGAQIGHPLRYPRAEAAWTLAFINPPSQVHSEQQTPAQSPPMALVKAFYTWGNWHTCVGLGVPSSQTMLFAKCLSPVRGQLLRGWEKGHWRAERRLVSVSQQERMEARAGEAVRPGSHLGASACTAPCACLSFTA